MNIKGLLAFAILLPAISRSNEGTLYLSASGGWGAFYAADDIKLDRKDFPNFTLEFIDSKRTFGYLYGLRVSQSCLFAIACSDGFGDYMSTISLVGGKHFNLSQSIFSQILLGPEVAFGAAGEKSLLAVGLHMQGEAVVLLSDEVTGIGVGIFNDWTTKKSNVGASISYNLIFDYPLFGESE